MIEYFAGFTGQFLKKKLKTSKMPKICQLTRIQNYVMRFRYLVKQHTHTYIEKYWKKIHIFTDSCLKRKLEFLG